MTSSYQTTSGDKQGFSVVRKPVFFGCSRKNLDCWSGDIPIPCFMRYPIFENQLKSEQSLRERATPVKTCATAWR